MRKERAGHTLQTSALVNEAYLRLIDYRRMQWQNRAHFFAVAAQAMRRVLVDHARAQQAAKRGAGGQKVSLDEAAMISDVRAEELLALDEALGKLEQLDERRSQIAEMRYIGGLSAAEVAGVMGISTRTVEREWRSAKAWVYKAISEGKRDER